MQQDQFEKLFKAAEEGAYLPIGITEDGTPVTGGFVPWEKTISAFNMKTPKVTLAVSDLSDEAVLEMLGKCRITGCYILAPLKHYGFISGFKDLQDLFILHAEYMKDLSFLRGLTELFMFYLKDAALPDIAPLAEAFASGDRIPGKCLGLCNCSIEDVSAFAKADIRFSELLIWPLEGDCADRWKTANRPGTFRFYKK